MTEKDEQRDRREQTPAAADVTMVLAVLAGRFDKVEGQLSEFHRRSAHRESIIDRLHEENQRLRGGIERAVLDPVVADLIRLYDQLSQEARRLEADGAGGDCSGRSRTTSRRSWTGAATRSSPLL